MNWQQKRFRVIPYLLVIVSLIIALCYQSRSFVLGYSVAGIALYLISTSKVNLKTLLSFTILIISIIIILVFFVKSDSSEGRLLIYKVSFNILKDHWQYGIGLGNFKTQYLYFQAAYFAREHYTTKELLLAGNTYFAFNDYYQLVIELGIAGMIFCLFIIFLIIKLFQAAIKSTYNSISFVVISHLIAIGVAALFTHIFERIFFQIVVIIGVNTLLYIFLQSRFYRAGIVLTTIIGVMIITIYHYYFQIIKYNSYSQFNNAVTLNNAGFKHRSFQKLDSLSRTLHSCPEYLIYYGKELLLADSVNKADTILKRASFYYIDNQLFLDRAKCNAKLNKAVEAERYFHLAIYMVPNRFDSRYELYKFYITEGKKSQAEKVKFDILNIPVKVKSPRVDFIKKEVSK